ncbi:hypothetical protein VNI00_012185 [Paramarasmius palmivorus]|uniref:Receptor ligand binding region domain-containing protein n=1 Tax=Paramarasmius palmivorus TaxID=297713 RepID=A0AAW0C705_9AGAR
MKRICQPRETTANFLQSQLYQSRDKLFANSIAGGEQDACKMNTGYTGYENAVILQGISLLNKVVNSTEYNAIINDLVVGITSNTKWHNSAGILSATDVSGTYIPRGMVQVYNVTTDMKLREICFNLSYNAIMDNGAGDGNIYGPTWTSRVPSIKYDGGGQSKAISGLLATIPVSSENGAGTSVSSSPTSLSSTPVSSSTDDSSENENKSSTPVGAIVGAVVGGLAFIGISVVFVLWFFRRRPAKNQIEHESVISSHRYSSVPSNSTLRTTDVSQADTLPRQPVSRKQTAGMGRQGGWDSPPDYRPH